MTNIECAHFQSDYYPEFCMSFLFKSNFIRYVYILQECIIWFLLFLRGFFCVFFLNTGYDFLELACFIQCYVSESLIPSIDVSH